MRRLRHRDGSANVLYDFTQLAGLSEDKNRLVFMSQRDMSIIYSALEHADRVQTRVFSSVHQEHYVIVEDADFFTFAGFINSVRVGLGEWPVSNEYLERIAVALESIDAKAVERITWQEMIDDLEATLGIGNAFVEIIKWVGGLFPQVRLKLDFTQLVLSAWEYFAWRAPILALLTGINASLAATAAAQIAEKPLLVIRTVLDAFNSALNVNNRIYEFILGDWNWYDDVLKPMWDTFVSDGEGGTGGADPDNDADLRPIVNVFDNDVFSCAPDLTVNCGGGGSAGSGSTWGDDGITLAPELALSPGDPATDPPPPDFEDWAAYDAYKCQVATWMAESLIGGFQWAAGLGNLGVDVGVGGLTVWVSTLLKAIVTRASFARLLGYAFVGAEGPLLFGYALGVIGANPIAWIGIATALGTLLVLAYASVQYCGDIATLLEGEKDDMICDLYSAADAAAAGTVLRARVLAHVTTVVEGWAVSIGETIGINAIMTFYDYIWGDNRILNMLFVQDAGFIAVAGSYAGDCPCESCVNCIERHDSSGTYLADKSMPDSDFYVVTSAAQAAHHHIIFRVVSGGPFKLEFQNISGWTQHVPGGDNFILKQDDGAIIYSGNSFSSFAAAAAAACIADPGAGVYSQWYLISNTSFTVEVKGSYCEI